MSLTNAQYQSIIRKYENTRDENRRLLEKRKSEVYKQIPSYKALEASVGSIAVAKAKLMLEGNQNVLEDLHSEIAKNAAKRKMLLKAAGFPPDYLEPIFTCPACKDTGYILSENGQKTKCHCFRQQEITFLYAQSNIQNIIAKENFSTLSYQYYEGIDLEHFKSAVKICQNFIKNFKQDYHNLLFYGTVGTGKSFLSGCIANELLKQGFSVIYFSSIALFETLAHYSFEAKDKETFYNFCEDLYHCDLIIIDDLGAELTNTFVCSQLFSFLNERHVLNKSTIISTNFTLGELRDRYSDRIFSRITSNSQICKLTGLDIRMHKKRMAHASNV